jgi:hypothetical protein
MNVARMVLAPWQIGCRQQCTRSPLLWATDLVLVLPPRPSLGSLLGAGFGARSRPWLVRAGSFAGHADGADRQAGRRAGGLAWSRPCHAPSGAPGGPESAIHTQIRRSRCLPSSGRGGSGRCRRGGTCCALSVSLSSFSWRPGSRSAWLLLWRRRSWAAGSGSSAGTSGSFGACGSLAVWRWCSGCGGGGTPAGSCA